MPKRKTPTKIESSSQSRTTETYARLQMRMLEMRIGFVEPLARITEGRLAPMAARIRENIPKLWAAVKAGDWVRATILAFDLGTKHGAFYLAAYEETFHREVARKFKAAAKVMTEAAKKADRVRTAFLEKRTKTAGKFTVGAVVRDIAKGEDMHPKQIRRYLVGLPEYDTAVRKRRPKGHS